MKSPYKTQRARIPMAVRFWEKVKKTNRCWLWTGKLDQDGYGRIWSGDYQQKMLRAPRASWMLHRGLIPDGLHVLHRCDNPQCVNPAHLFLGTIKDNNIDMTRKGRNIFQHRNPVKKLTDQQIRSIRSQRSKGKLLRELSKAFGVTEGTISRIVHRVRRPRVD